MAGHVSVCDHKARDEVGEATRRSCCSHNPPLRQSYVQVPGTNRETTRAYSDILDEPNLDRSSERLE
jgi:hypothetical protein